MAKYDYMNYCKLNNFIDILPDTQKEQFQAIIQEGHLVTRTALQTALDATDTAAHSVSTVVVMSWASWLHLLELLKEMQITIENLLFEGSKLFVDKMDASVHNLKHHRATLRSLGIYTLGQKRKFSSQPHRSQEPQFPPGAAVL